MDDHECSHIDIAWMPSHTSVEEIGITMLSDGTALTAHDRRGNGEADRLAKMAAMWHRVPESVRRRMAADMEIAVQLRRWIGQAIAVAGNFAAPDGTIWRDSKPADRRLRTAQTRVERQARSSAAAQPALLPRQTCANATQAAGGVVFKREPRIPAPDSWCMTAAGGAEQCLCTARGGNVPTGDNISLADTMCQFPFTHENVTYTDCIPLGRSHPWCYTDEATGTWGFCTAGCPLACWGLPDEGHPAPFGTYRCQFPFVDDGGDEHNKVFLDPAGLAA